MAMYVQQSVQFHEAVLFFNAITVCLLCRVSSNIINL